MSTHSKILQILEDKFISFGLIMNTEIYYEMSKRILCIFPNDPLIAYYKKGEIKKRYFNPENIFDEVHCISLIEKDIDVEKIQETVGTAKLKIHSVGKINLKNKKENLDSIINLVKEINPDIIRAYNPLIEGWLAAKCSQKLNIPFFLSLHTQYDANRKLAKRKNFKKYLKLKYTEKFIEPFVLESANKITIVYKIIESYVLKHSTTIPEILHNKVDCDRFFNSKSIDALPQPLILSVGNLTPVKNHKILIKSMQKIDGHLLIIGSGELYDELNNLIKKLNIQEKVGIKKSVPYENIQKYYKSAKIFALAFNSEIESIPMPIIEAMAAGLPIVIPYPKKGNSEGLEDVAIFSKNNNKSFESNFKMILDDKNLQEQLSKKSLQKSKEFDILRIEAREAEIYKELIKHMNSSERNN